MVWKHYQSTYTRTVTAIKDGMPLPCNLVIGRVHTGKQRVFVGYFCKIDCDGTNIIMEHTGSLIFALRTAAREFSMLGYALNIYGLQNGSRQSGLLDNTCGVYVPQFNHAVLMIDEVKELI